jgi:hypothetical protein
MHNALFLGNRLVIIQWTGRPILTVELKHYGLRRLAAPLAQQVHSILLIPMVSISLRTAFLTKTNSARGLRMVRIQQ